MRSQLCRAKGVSPRDLFGRAGRHGDVINALRLGSARFKRIGVQYRRLHIERVRSDYRYTDRVTRYDADRALGDAEWVVSQLTGIPKKEFSALLFAPHQQP